MSFSSFVCRSSRSFFVCVAFRVRFRSFRVSFEFEFSCRILKSILEFDFSNSRSRILKSNFEFVFFASLLYSISRISIFDSNFEFKFLEFSCRISNSSFSLRCSIRLLEIDRQIRLLELRFSIRISNSSALIFRFEVVVEIFVPLLYSTSRISIRKFRCSIRLLEIDRQIRLLEFRVVDSSALNFEVVLIYSTSRISIRIRRRNFDSKLSSKLSFASRILSLSSSSNFATFVARRSRCPICIALMH